MKFLLTIMSTSMESLHKNITVEHQLHEAKGDFIILSTPLMLPQIAVLVANYIPDVLFQ